MAGNFRIGLDATIAGATQYRQFENQVRALGGTLHDLQEDLVDINGTPTRVFKVRVEGINRATRDSLKLFLQGTNRVRGFGAAMHDIDPTIENVTKHLKDQQKALLSAQKAAANFQQTLNNRLLSANALQQQKIGNTTLAQNNRRALDAAEFDRRFRAREAADVARDNRRLQQTQQRHALAMQRINAYGGGGNFGGPVGTVSAALTMGSIGKVIAYDAIRRSLTNIYQTLGRVGDKMGEIVVDSIEFNDELNRSRTVFTTLGMIGMKNADGTAMTMAQAENGNSADRAGLAAAKKVSDDMMLRLQGVSALSGQDMNEIVSSARQLLPDLINKMTGPDGKNPLSDPKSAAMLMDTTEQMAKLASVLKMSDPGGRKLGWHMTAIAEALSGSSGGKKVTGREAVRSLRTRENIKVSDKDALALTQAIDTKQVDKAAKLITQILEKAGVGVTTLYNQLDNTISSNLDGIKNSLQIFGTTTTQALYDKILKSVTQYRLDLAGLLKNHAFMESIKDAGEEFSKAFQPIFNEITMAIDYMKGHPDAVGKVMKNISTGMSDYVEIMMNVGKGLFKFVGGFLGAYDNKKLDVSSIQKSTKAFEQMAPQIGQKMRDIMNELLKALAPITENMVPALVAALDSLAVVAKIVAPAIKIIVGLFREIVNLPGIKQAMNWAAGEDTMNTTNQQMNKFLGYTDPNEKTNVNKIGSFLNPFTGVISEMNYERGRTTDLEMEVARARATSEAVRKKMAQKLEPAVMNPASGGTIAPVTGYNPLNFPPPPIKYSAKINYGGGWKDQERGSSGSDSWEKSTIKPAALAPLIARHIEKSNKPVIIQPGTLKNETKISIGTITLNTNNIQEFIDNLVRLGRGTSQDKSGGKTNTGIPANYAPSVGISSGKY